MRDQGTLDIHDIPPPHAIVIKVPDGWRVAFLERVDGRRVPIYSFAIGRAFKAEARAIRVASAFANIERRAIPRPPAGRDAARE